MAYQRWWKTVRDQQGNAVNGASVAVYNGGTGTLATVYDPNTDDSAPGGLANPFVTGANGVFGFMAADGEYDVQISGGNGATQQYRVRLSSAKTSDLEAQWQADDAVVAADAAAATAGVYSDLAATTGAGLVGYLAPFTGAVERDQSQINAESYSVIQAGADPTGVADSTAAFQSAITNHPFPRIPAGTYKLASSVLLDGTAYDGRRFIGDGVDKVIINYTGSDYAFKWNSDDTNPNIVRRSGISGASIVGTSAGLGALKIQASSELIFENLYLTGFTNAAAKVIFSNSTLDYGWGATFRNVTAKHNEGSLASWWINRFTWLLMDHCYASNGGTYAMVIGSGVTLNMLNPAIESHTYGLVLTTGLAANPLQSVNIINPNFEVLKFGIDINNLVDAGAGIAPGSEYTYGIVIDNPLFGGTSAPTGDYPIRIGKARHTTIRNGFLYSPNTAGTALLDILANAEDTSIENTYFSANGGHADIANAGIRTRFTKKATSYTPTWTAAGTAPSLGDGTLAGQYSVQGNLCTVQITLTGGSTTTFGTNTWRFALPFAVGGASRVLGQCVVKDASAGTTWAAIASADNGTLLVTIPAAKDAGFGVDYQNPMTWAVSDRLDLQITYPLF